MKRSYLSGLLGALLLSSSSAYGEFIFSFDPTPSIGHHTNSGPGSPISVKLWATNNGAANDDLLFFTTTLVPNVFNPKVTIDNADLSYNGPGFFGGDGISPDSSGEVGTFNFTLAVDASFLGGDLTTFEGNVFSLAEQPPLTVTGPQSLSVSVVPEPSSFFLFGGALFFAAFGRRRVGRSLS